jgi:hypothetical protein
MKVIKLVLAVLLLLCLLNWNYGYYQFVRFIGLIGFSVLSYQQYKKNDVWFIIWLASAILINPFFKIALGRTLWNIVDVLWSILLIYSFFFESGIKTSKQKNN